MAKKTKTSKLPFLVTPRLQPIEEVLGSEATGQIKIRRQGYLSVGERAFMSNVEANDDSTKTTLEVCRKVANELELDLNTAYESVVAAATGQGVDKHGIGAKYPEEMKELLTSMISSESRRSYMKSLCLLIYRVDSEISIEDIADLHPDLLEELVDLYHDEEQKSIARLEGTASSEQDAAVIEDAVKK